MLVILGNKHFLLFHSMIYSYFQIDYIVTSLKKADKQRQNRHLP